MSDFLSRLADRALGKDAPVTPRLRSLFEPERLVSGTGLGWTQASSHGAEGTSADVRPPTGMATGREPDLGRRGAGLGWPGSPAPKAGQTVTARLASEPRDGRARGPAAATASSASASASLEVTAGGPAVNLPSHLDVTDVPDRSGAEQRAAQLRPSGTGTGLQAFQPSRGRARAAHPGQHPADGIEPPSSARLVLHEDAWPVPAGSGVQPSGVPSPGSEMAGRAYDVLAARVLRPHDRTRAMQSQDPEPVINITIGRIDVRAGSAPDGELRARPAPRGEPEPLGLNEYLRRREQRR